MPRINVSIDAGLTYEVITRQPVVIDPPPSDGMIVQLLTANTFASQNGNVPTWAPYFADVIDSQSGGAFNPYWGGLGCIMFSGGGHASSNDNSVVVLDLNDMTYKRLSEPTRDGWNPSPLMAEFGEYADGQPGASHTYDNLAILPPEAGGGQYGSLIRVQGQAVESHASVDSGWAHQFVVDPAQATTRAGKWQRYAAPPSGTLPFVPGGCSAYDSARKRFWYLGALSYAPQTMVRYIDCATRTKGVEPMATPTPQCGTDASFMLYDRVRDILILARARVDGVSGLFWGRPWVRQGWAFGIELPKASKDEPLTGDYVPELDAFVFLAPGDRHAFQQITIPADPAQPWTLRRLPVSNGPIPLAWMQAKRFCYVPALKRLVWKPTAAGPVYSFNPL